jgi:hypothetical protein
LAQIREIIDRTDTTDQVKKLANRIFEIVAEAEARAHHVPVEQVHFHEVGAVDSIVDIMSAAYLIESLSIDRAVVSELYEGRGQVKCQHGILPVPVPAVVNIATAHGLSLHLTETEGEMITPTGAAIAAALSEYGKEKKSGQNVQPKGKLMAVGTGAGKKEFPHANILRAMLFEEKKEEQDPLWMLETNMDDVTGEALGYVSEKLLDAGARDVFYEPIYMKKNRPAYLLHVLCQESLREEMEKIIFLHTTTIGIRRYQVERTVLERHVKERETSFGKVKVKEIRRPDGTYVMPEYESVREICDRTGMGFLKLYEEIRREVEEKG